LQYNITAVDKFFTMQGFIFIGSCNFPGLGHGDDYTQPTRIIYSYRLTNDGTLLEQSVFDTGAHNPAFLCVSKDGTRMFSVGSTNVGGAGELLSFAVDPEKGKIVKELSVVDSQGICPCHCSLDASERWLFVANYPDGSIATIPILPDGSLGPAADSKYHRGVVVQSLADRQESSHVHMIRQHPVYKDYVFVADLGLDCLWVYHFDVKTGGLRGPARDTRHVMFTRGVGPRHFDFHPSKPDVVYVIHELAGTVSVVHLKTHTHENTTQIVGGEEVQSISTLKSSITCSRGAHLGCSDIHVSSDGLFLYGLNRTDQTIAIFSIGNDSTLELRGHVPTMGKISRNFAIISLGENDWFVVANQESKTVVVYKRNKDNGWLTDPHEVNTNVWPTSVVGI